MMIRAPRFTIAQLEALRDILRIDFTRAVKYIIVRSHDADANGEQEHPSDTTGKMLTLVNAFNDNEQPLLIVASFMRLHNTNAGTMPLNATRFDFYKRLVNHFTINEA